MLLLHARSSNRNLPPDLDHLIGRETEEVADMDSVALHHSEHPFLTGRQAQVVLAADDGFAADIIGEVVEVDRTPQRFAGGEQFRNLARLFRLSSGCAAPPTALIGFPPAAQIHARAMHGYA